MCRQHPQDNRIWTLGRVGHKGQLAAVGVKDERSERSDSGMERSAAVRMRSGMEAERSERREE